MRRYTKDDVEFHSDGCGRTGHPAVNVKAYHFPSSCKVADKFGCTEEQAERAIEYAFESAQQSFWESINTWAEEVFGKGVKVYSEGRSGGWAVVHGLPSFDGWNAIDLAKWRKFENMLKREVVYQTSFDTMCEAIEANQWHLDGSELYNFIETKDGKNLCIAELKQQAKESGFGPVVR